MPDFEQCFSELRSLLQEEEWSATQRQLFWRWIELSSRMNRQVYDQMILPYVSEFSRHFEESVHCCRSIEELELAMELCPHAVFSLRLFEYGMKSSTIDRALDMVSTDRVQALFINGGTYSSAQCERLYDAPHPALRSLTFHNANFEGHSSTHSRAMLVKRLAQAKGLVALESLHMHSGLNPTTVRALISAKAFSRLKHLSLSGELRADGGQAIAEGMSLPNLTSLDLNNCTLGGEGVKRIAKSPWLSTIRTLSLAYNKMGAKGLRALARSPHLTSLKSLVLSGNKIGEKGIKELEYKKVVFELEELDLKDNELGPEAARVLAHTPHLQALTTCLLDDNNITDEGGELLAQACGHGKLRTLSLKHAQLSSATFVALLDAPHFMQLEELYFRDNSLRGYDMEVMHRVKHTSLLKLDLSNCYLGDEGVARMVTAPCLARLESLGLTACDVTVSGASALAASQLKALRVLDLGANRLGAEGVAALVGTHQLSGLRRVNLSRTHMGDQGLKSLVQATHLKHLTHLVLRDNQIFTEGLEALSQAMHWFMLEELDLGHNNMYGHMNILMRYPHLRALNSLFLRDCNLGRQDIELLQGTDELSTLRYLDPGVQEGVNKPSAPSALWDAFVRHSSDYWPYYFRFVL